MDELRERIDFYRKWLAHPRANSIRWSDADIAYLLSALGTLQDAHEGQRLHLQTAIERMNAAEAEREMALDDMAAAQGRHANAEMRNAKLTAALAQMREALKLVTDNMDQAGGDRDGMPECPWCHVQDAESHAGDCELMRARAALTSACPAEREGE